MKLTILGNNGPYPQKGGACSGYLLSSDSGRTNIIIDFGTGCLSNLPAHISYADINAMILSHLHFDHMSDMLPLQYALQFNPAAAPIPVFAPDAPAPVRELLNAPCFNTETIRNCEIGEMSIRVIPARHPVPTYAVRVECDGKVFGYTGDSNTLDTLPAFFEGCDLLLADAGLSLEHWNPNAPHFSAAGCGSLASSANAGKLLLTHLNPRYTTQALVDEARTEFTETQFTVIGESYRV